MILSSIAAMAQNRVIGNKGKLPWHLPEDLAFFKAKTKGKILIMGRKTYESLGKPLPNRFHIVVSREHSFSGEQVTTVKNIVLAIEEAKKRIPPYPDEVFVVGGGEIYRQSIDLIDRLYLTVIEKDFEGDAYFPDFDESQFRLTERQDRNQPLNFSFRTYTRL